MKINYRLVSRVYLLCVIFLFLGACAGPNNSNEIPEDDSSKIVEVHDSIVSETTIKNLEIPALNQTDRVIVHLAYSLVYSDQYKQPVWVAYELTKEELIKKAKRTNKFISDPNITSMNNFDADYQRSKYDRGHLAPAADMGFSMQTMKESFYYSNVSPQEQEFNRGIWNELEQLVRVWAKENDAIYIVTGPVLKDGLKTIGAHKIAVPSYFYKVILDYREPEVKGVGFIIPNKASDEKLQRFAVTIDSVETFTGLDFFPALPDDQEKVIEKTVCKDCWSWETGRRNKKRKR